MTSGCRPFLKWPGGKRWLAPVVVKLINEIGFQRYFEPFLGGGAVFFALRPTNAVLSDVNPDLVNVYSQVKRVPGQLVEELKRIPVAPEVYDEMRSACPRSKVQSAVRLLFLNRTSFSGIYRLNRKGEYNVPYGGGQRRPDVLWQQDLLTAASDVLRTAQIRCGDFETMLSEARRGDLAYCDPTYTVAHNNNGFVRYNESNFSWGDQVRLAQLCGHLRARGVTVLVSNAYHEEVRRLYLGAEVQVIDRLSLLCPDPTKRKATKEFLFILRP